MTSITHVEALIVDLVPKVRRTDAVQSFVSQETPTAHITDADGAVGTGYSYTIGTDGRSVMALICRARCLTTAPMRIEDGHAIPSDQPGLGIAWDADAITHATVDGSALTIN
jgi:L-alanine-DL-glutamate epimerase-like enolase superfamily enzyme